MNRLNKVWILAVAGAVLYWLSLPPLKFPWAAYLACSCFVAIVARECELTRRDYFHVWLAGLGLWLALLQGIRLAFWPLYFGWMTLAAYVAVYLPLFVGSARKLYHQWRVPLPIAASIAWVGFELIRAYFATGFAACMLAHSQTPWPWMLPIASQLGGYGVSLIVMFTGAVLYQWAAWILSPKASPEDIASTRRSKRLLASCIVCTFIAALSIALSVFSLRARDQWLAEHDSIKPIARVLLIQDDMPTMFDVDEEGLRLGWQRYDQQTAQAAKTTKRKAVDLVVWPESTFGGGIPWMDWDKSPGIPPEFQATEEEFLETYQRLQSNNQFKLERIFDGFGEMPPQFLVGTDVYVIRGGKLSRYNAALSITAKDINSPTFYAKQHLVMFGEYIPILSSFPELMASIGMGKLDVGREPVANELANGAIYSTSICFEDVVPHGIQQHVNRLTDRYTPPAFLVNITNDAWFRGSSILDHHLNNAILVAVENRRPMLVAANQGISAWIDGDGRVVRSLPRLDAGSILAEPIHDGRWGLWQTIGDWPARLLACLALAPLCGQVYQRLRPRRKQA